MLFIVLAFAVGFFIAIQFAEAHFKSQIRKQVKAVQKRYEMTGDYSAETYAYAVQILKQLEGVL